MAIHHRPDQAPPAEDADKRHPVNDDIGWRDTLLGQLQHYRKHAPYFNAVSDLVCASVRETDGSLARLNVASLARVCDYLEIPFRYSLFSEMELDLGSVEGPGDWALRIAEAMGASEYVNAPGGAHLFDQSKFRAAGITLTIQSPLDFSYSCCRYEFQSGLSIVDVMMWNSPGSIRAYLTARSPAEQRKEET